MERNIIDIHNLLEDIKNLVKPSKVILFHRKVENDGKTLSFKVCVITERADKFEIEKEIYKHIDSDIPFDVIIYTCDEWDRLKLNTNSFANKILHRGHII